MTPTIWKLATTKAALADLALPLGWRKPRHVATDDLFASLSNEQIAAAFGVMAACHESTFDAVTAHAERMGQWFTWASAQTRYAGMGSDPADVCQLIGMDAFGLPGRAPTDAQWPLPNVTIGVRISDQASADEQILYLLDAPAAFRVVVCDPLAGPVDLRRVRCKSTHADGSARTWDALTTSVTPTTIDDPRRVNLVRVAGEAGTNARPCDLAWVQSLVDQCKRAGVPVEVTRLGSNVVEASHAGGVQRVTLRERSGSAIDEWPDDLKEFHPVFQAETT